MNPEFKMQGISFVISSPGGGEGHALPFRLSVGGRTVEVQRSLRDSFTVEDVALMLHQLAADLIETTGAVQVPSQPQP